MKRLYAWLAGFVGGAAVYRAFRRQPQAVPVAEPDPAEELKAKLAEARVAGDEPPAETDAAPESDVDARRHSVHERARAAIDEMHSDD